VDGGTTVRTARRSRIAWDVPVRLVRDDGAPRSERSVGPLDLGLDIPGGSTTAGLPVVRVTLGDRAGRSHLLRIEPDERTPTCPVGELAPLLDELRDPDDGALPVLVDGSAFTLEVLTALSRIPLGERRTYAELAAAAGRPRAVRAVASVMARNRTPLVLPCHRIVPSSGGTGRYAWGAATKTALLAAEERYRADAP
jgi:O-6-methylguanine DNA methyltransferase